MNRKTSTKTSVSRRQFLLAGGAAAAASGLPGIAGADEEQENPKVKRYRTLGRTGFEVTTMYHDTRVSSAWLTSHVTVCVFFDSMY